MKNQRLNDGRLYNYTGSDMVNIKPYKETTSQTF